METRALEDRADESQTPLWLKALSLAGLSLFMSVFAWYTMLLQYPHTQWGDGQYFHRMFEVARVSVVRYHELPLWNPYECGGIPLWDSPQDLAAAPLLWPALFFGATLAVYFWCVVHGALGFVSMWLFARAELSASRKAAFAAASAWAFSTVVQQHSSTGHLAFVGFVYLPLVLHLWRRAEREMRAAVWLGLLIAWVFAEGGVYPLPHIALFMAADALTRAYPLRRFVAIVRAGLVSIAVALVVGAARFLPVMAQLRAHSRNLGPETDSLTWKFFVDMFLARHNEWRIPGLAYVWGEYASYIGPLLALVVFFGLVTAGRRYAWLYALLALAVALTWGHFHPLAPASILKSHIFPFKEMRVPARFRYEVTFFFAAFVSLAIDNVPRQLARVRRLSPFSRRVGFLLFAVALVGVGDVVSVNLGIIESRFNETPAKVVAPNPRLFLEGGGLAAFIDQPRQNRGRMACWSEWGFHQGAKLWTGDVPQARADGGGAVVEVGNRTQNTFTIDVDVKAPSRILVNSAYDHGWRSNVGTVVENEHQLAVDLPPGHHRVKLRYWPHYMTLGLVLTVLGLLATTAYLLRLHEPIHRLYVERTRKASIKSDATGGESAEHKGRAV